MKTYGQGLFIVASFLIGIMTSIHLMEDQIFHSPTLESQKVVVDKQLTKGVFQKIVQKVVE